MRKINQKLFLTLKVVYLITFVVAAVALLLTPSRPELGFIQGGIIEITLLFTSIILLHNLKIRLALISGILGSLILGIDILYAQFMMSLAEGYIGFETIYNYTTIVFAPICLTIILCVNLILIIGKLWDRKIDFNKLKKEIVDLSVEFTRFEIKAISEKLNQDPALIAELIQDMVDKQEIYGYYFKSTKTVAFNQQANIDEIDKLLSKFSEFEEKQMGKKI